MKVKVDYDFIFKTINDCTGKIGDLNRERRALLQLAREMKTIWRGEDYYQFRGKMDDFNKEITNFVNQLENYNSFIKNYVNKVKAIDSKYNHTISLE